MPGRATSCGAPPRRRRSGGLIPVWSRSILAASAALALAISAADPDAHPEASDLALVAVASRELVFAARNGWEGPRGARPGRDRSLTATGRRPPLASRRG